jgi:membrane-associated protease RseP (regulator of RpoE activity)
MLFFWLLFLGIFTYVVVKRSVGSITRTPIWVLWLVMMMPAFTLAAWVIVNGAESPAPAGLLLVLFISCPLLYWGLLQWGRKPVAKPHASETGVTPPATTPPQPAKPVLRPIDKEEEATLQRCFPWTVYYLQNIEYRPQAMICRGQLRASPTVAYETVCDNIRHNFGDRFLVIFQEGLQGKPVFALVPNPQAQTTQTVQKPQRLTRPGLALGLFLVTLFTTTGAGAALAGISEAQLQTNPALFFQGLPYAVALMLILGCHEFGHYLMARRYNMPATLPYFIPVPFFLGTFGAFIQLRAPVPNRRALFDVGIAGPLAGLVVALPLLLWGLGQSTVVPMPPEGSTLLNFEALDPKASLMLALLAKLVLGGKSGGQPGYPPEPGSDRRLSGAGGHRLKFNASGPVRWRPHRPCYVWSAYRGCGRPNFSPAGVAPGVCPSRIANLGHFAVLYPRRRRTRMDDISELDDRRDMLGLLALTLLVMIVLPAPGIFTRLLF